MEITKKKNLSVDILEVSGKFDMVGSQKAQEIILPSIPKDGKLILDLADCDYVSSAGLRVLLIAANQSEMANCRMVVTGIQPAIWEIIVMTGFENVLVTYPSQADALKALEQ